jgi:hypothetical protein
MEEAIDKLQTSLNVIQKQLDVLVESNKQRVTSFNDDIVYLNVGGTVYTTTKETISTSVPSIDSNTGLLIENQSEHHMLSSMFSGNFDLTLDKNENVFIDRDGKYFRYILNYLRCLVIRDLNKLLLPFEKELIVQELINDAEFYGLEHFKELLISRSSQVQELFPESKIVSNRDKFQLNDWYGSKNQKWRRIYLGSEHGFTAKNFHFLCDNRGPTYTIIRSHKGSIFGGYASESWNSSKKHMNDTKAFTFLLCHPSNIRAKYPDEHPERALYGSPNHLTVFSSLGMYCIISEQFCH